MINVENFLIKHFFWFLMVLKIENNCNIVECLEFQVKLPKNLTFDFNFKCKQIRQGRKVKAFFSRNV
jgi:hypothetical protein